MSAFQIHRHISTILRMPLLLLSMRIFACSDDRIGKTVFIQRSQLCKSCISLLYRLLENLTFEHVVYSMAQFFIGLVFSLLLPHVDLLILNAPYRTVLIWCALQFDRNSSRHCLALLRELTGMTRDLAIRNLIRFYRIPFLPKDHLDPYCEACFRIF